MADRAARLEELRKIVGVSSIEELEKRTELNLDKTNLTSVPLGVCDLTNLVKLGLHDNQLSSLPPEISRLTGLVVLRLWNNRLSSLPPEISRLTGLTFLGVNNNQLSSLPPEISRLTGLKELGVGNNQLSSLPPEISRLTGLALLAVFQNPIEELLPQITALTRLKDFYIEWEGKMTIKRAPCGITNLPCWNNTSKPDSQMTYSFADALRKLQLYDAMDTAAEARKKAEEARKKAEEARKAEEAKQNLLHEKGLQFIQAHKTVHPEQSKTDHKPFAEGEVFQVQSATPTAGLFKVSNTDGEFYIEHSHVKVLSKGCCGNASPKDQHKRRLKLAKIQDTALEAEVITESTATIVNDEGLVDEQEAKASEAEINACLTGGLCAVCFSQYKDPCFLPCNHVFCSECIKTSIIASKEEPPFRCPLCSALAYIDEESVDELKPFKYDPTALGGMNAGLEGGKDKGGVKGFNCMGKTKGVKCTEKATQYCVICGGDGVYCETHGEVHTDAYDETHIVKELQYGALPSAKKTEKCLIHKSFPIEFYCPSCPESPLKCAKCALEDRTHLDEHKELSQQGFDTKSIITKKAQELRVVEGKLAPNLEAIEKKIKDAKKQNEKKTSELDSFIKELEDQVKLFKEQAKKKLVSLNQSIISPLEESQKKLLSEMRRIQIAKQTLAKISEKADGERSLTQMGNALRFANQVLYSKHNTSIQNVPLNIASKIPRTILDDLKKLNESFMFGLSDAEIKKQQQRPEVTEKKTESLHSIPIVPSTISAVARATFDSSSPSAEKVKFPWGICAHPKNSNIYVTDEDLQSVRIFDKNLKLLSSHHTGLITPKTLHGPRGIAISNDGLIAIADCEGHAVKLYTDEFTFAKSIGDQKGSQEGQFNRPYSVAFDSEGNLYVADSGNMRVQKFNSKGEFISIIGNQTEKGGSLTSLVNGVCVNEEDKLLVLCAGSDHVRVFFKDGAFENNVKLEVPTSIEGWSHIFHASQGIFGVCENKTGVITFYNYEGKVQHRITLNGCIGACFGLDSAFYATSLSAKSISLFSAASE